MSNELRTIGLAGLLCLALFACGLALYQTNSGTGTIEQPWLHAGQWLLQSTLLWAFVFQQIWTRRELNRFATDTVLYIDLGHANRLTILRGWLIAATGGFLLQPQYIGFFAWVPAGLYSLAAILDRVDGFVARRTKRTSLMGNELDTVFDAMGLLVAPLLAVAYGKVHWSYLFVSVAYYLFRWGIQRRKKNSLPVYPLAPNHLRRTLAGFQMAYIAVVLWPPFQAQITVIAGFGFMLPLLAGFFVDWLTVSGRINQKSADTARFFSRLRSFSESFLQPALRLLLVSSLLFLIWKLNQTESIAANMFFLIGLLVASLLVLTGIAGRIGAAAILWLLAWSLPPSMLDLVACTALFSAILLLLLGCGRYSIWQWDDYWVNKQDGA